MPAKKQKGKKEAVPATNLEALPGPDLLKPVLTYSEDDPLGACYSKKHIPPEADEPPQDEDSSQFTDDAASLPGMAPEFMFDLDECQSGVENDVFRLAEENSDDAKSLSSITDQDVQDIAEPDPSEDSEETDSLSTGSDSRRDAYDACEMPSDGDSSDQSSFGPIKESMAIRAPVTVKQQPGTSGKPQSAAATVSEAAKEPVSRKTGPKEEWLIRKLAVLMVPESQRTGLPLFLSVNDLLETNLDFKTMTPETIEKLKHVTERSSSPDTNEEDFERPASFVHSSNCSRPRIKHVKHVVRAPSATGAGKDHKKEHNHEGHKNGKKKEGHEQYELEKAPTRHKRFPAEQFNEQTRRSFSKKPFVVKSDLCVTSLEQDAWVTESCDDFNFIEYRRGQILRGEKIPVGTADAELDMVSTRLAKKLLKYEAALDEAFPDNDREPTELLTFNNDQELPREPLVPVHVNPEEDPDNEDTTSQEDGHEGGKNSGAREKVARKRKRHKHPYIVHPPVNEDDKHDYYNSERSSSEHESASEEVRNEIARKVQSGKGHREDSDLALLEVSEATWNVPLSLDEKQIKKVPFDNLYALAHDLEMPPSELRKELFAPGEEFEFDQDSDEEGWKDVAGAFIYEKTPEFYAVQIKDLEDTIRLCRDQWILLDLDHHEFSIQSRLEIADIEEFVGFLPEETKRDAKKVAGLKIKREKLQELLVQTTEHQNKTTKWLEEQQEKMMDQCTSRRNFFQIKLFVLHEFVGKQRRIEDQMNRLRKKANRAKANYIHKVSRMILHSARQKNKLFRNYKRKVLEVFKEYQRALILSMNDNLQEICCDHVDERERSKRFSDKALEMIVDFHKLAGKLTSANTQVESEKEMLKVSEEYGHYVYRMYERVEKQSAQEVRKITHLQNSLKDEKEHMVNRRRFQEVSLENKTLAHLVSSLETEKSEINNRFHAETSVNFQMEKHLGNLRKAIESYLRYRDHTETKSLSRADLVEAFEDRFLDFLHYAHEIELPIGDKKNARKYVIADGDLGFIPVPIKTG